MAAIRKTSRIPVLWRCWNPPM